MRQEVFDFHKIERLDWNDFIERDENRDAISYLAKWPDWNASGIIIFGESGTGKTHLAALWAQTAAAVYILKESLNHDPRDLFDSECNFVIDNFDDFISPQSYDWIFHFLNIAKEKNRFFLMLGRSRSAVLNIGLNDLRSRLIAVPSVDIDSPGDDLLLKISQKIAKDLEISVPSDVLTLILNTVERNVNSVAKVLKILDKLSLQQKKTLSLSFVKRYFHDDRQK
jgi:chromosomal replication initiation ATPase DnaA